MDNFDLEITYENLSVEFIMSRMDSGNIAISKHKREFRWNLETQQSYIESLFDNKPMHPIVITRENQVMYVQDGKQRLETIRRYMNDGFVCNDSIYSKLSKYDKLTLHSCMLYCEVVNEPTEEQVDEIYKTLNERDDKTIKIQKFRRIAYRDSHLYNPETVEYAKTQLRLLCPHTNVTNHYVECGLEDGQNIPICDDCGKGV
jgi:hypothetical protein